MGLVSANDPQLPKRTHARLDASVCLGCGVCIRACPSGALGRKSRPQRITPLNSAQRAVFMANERGKFQELIFDNRALWSHRPWRRSSGSS
jgi:ferredoxin